MMEAKTSIPPKFFRDYPHRVPDWRWQQAVRGVDIHNDLYVHMAIRFHEAVTHAHETNDLRTAYLEYPDIYLAWDVYSEVVGNRKGELEARILAREPYDVIAKKLSLSVQSIVNYEAIFFNVSDRLDSPGYILHFAIGEINQPQDLELDDRFWKFYGYWCGPEILDYIVYKAVPSNVGSDADVDRLIQDRIRKILMLNFTSGSFKDKAVLMKLLDMYVKRMNHLEMTGQNKDEQAILSKLGDVLLSINWQTASMVSPSSEENQQLLLDDLIDQNHSEENEE